MKTRTFVYILLAIFLLFVTVLFSFGESIQTPQSALSLIVYRSIPKPPALHYSIWRTAPLTVAEVFGRAQGCADASPDLIEMTARAALRASLDPAIAAATVAVESACNDYAISSRGAVGLMQVRVSTWKDTYDFAGAVNMFNEETNVRIGSEIMAKLIAERGTAAGIQAYNGDGIGCPTCDSTYSARILALAHR